MKAKKNFNRQTTIVYLISAALFALILNFDNPIISANNYLDKSRTFNVENDSPTANVELARLVAPDGFGDGGGDQLGRNVAISGNTAIVGSATHNVGQNTDQGAAYIFVRSGTTWTFQQELVASNGAFMENFGNSVAISGDTALVGAAPSTLGAPSPGTQQGAVYVFTRSGTTWTQTQKLVSGLTQTNQYFGASIAMTDTTAIISSPGDTIGANANQGSAYIFTRSGSSWGFQARIMAADGAADDQFGGDTTFRLTKQVDINGDTAIVGVIGGNFSTLAGSAYVFTRSGTNWTQQQKLTAFDAQMDDQFGVSVAVSGNTLIVGANFDDIGTRPDDGSAYVFTRTGATWTLQQKLLGDGNNQNGQDSFGSSVAIVGETALVGSPGDDLLGLDGFSNRGAAYLFKRAGTTWIKRTKFIANTSITTNPTNHSLGFSVALTGNTAVAGAPMFNNADGFVGAAYVFDTEAGNTPFDFDGDGRADIAVFRPSNGTWYLNQSSNGFSGFAFGLGTDKIVSADYDGDGKTDIAVFRNGVWYVQRSSLGFTGVAFGSAGDVPTPADFDGDGRADVAVFRPSNGVWYLNQSSAGFVGIAFGQIGDRPAAADYDGDGRTDVAVYRSGIWHIQRSSLGFTSVTFGDGADKPVPADYDGDGLTDIAVFRPSNGTWYLQQSQLGFAGIVFGAGTDVPVPADYDSDRKADVAVFRSSNGTWYLNQSANGFTGVQFGAANDQPIPSAFVP